MPFLNPPWKSIWKSDNAQHFSFPPFCLCTGAHTPAAVILSQSFGSVEWQKIGASIIPACFMRWSGRDFHVFSPRTSAPLHRASLSELKSAESFHRRCPSGPRHLLHVFLEIVSVNKEIIFCGVAAPDLPCEPGGSAVWWALWRHAWQVLTVCAFLFCFLFFFNHFVFFFFCFSSCRLLFLRLYVCSRIRDRHRLLCRDVGVCEACSYILPRNVWRGLCSGRVRIGNISF